MPIRTALLFFFLAACSTPPQPSALTMGGFEVRLDPAAAKVTIVGAGGRPLLEGLGARGVPGDGPPITGFALRPFAASYQMEKGSFKPTGRPLGPWQSVPSLYAQSDTAEEGHVVLTGPHGASLAKLTFTAPEAGHLQIAVTGGASGELFSWGFICAPEDHFAGFGAQTWDVDHRGFNVPIWVEEEGVGKVKTDDFDSSWLLGVGRRHSSYFPVPEYFSRRGYILVAETGRRSEFDLCAGDTHAARVQVELPATLHIFDGPDAATALNRATHTFGRPRVPPDFAFAPWNDAIGGSAEVRRVARKLRAEGIPSGAIWTEDYADFQWDLNTALYPDFAQLAADLHHDGYKFLLYFQPFVYKTKPVWKETAPRGYLIKNALGEPYEFNNLVYVDQTFAPQSLLDLSNPDARAWALGKMRAVIALGGDGWMGDFAEWLPTDAFTYTGSGLDEHNRYPVQWQALQREALDGAGDGIERLFFARSGYLGTPPLADVIWGGDQSVTFNEDDGFPTVLPIGIGLGIGGVSTFGSDIAGYLGVSSGSSKELWLRWCALGAWSPVMRTHHGYAPAQNWNWEKDAESVAHLRRYASLHMALFPYWKGLAVHAHDTGMPIWRGLALAYPSDETVWPLKDEVLVGDGLLVAPVVREGAVERDVYLPAGSWFPWDGVGGPLQGAKAIQAAVPVTDIAVFARAGTLVPMFPQGVLTLSDRPTAVPGPKLVGDDRIVRVFLGEAGEFTEAAGLTYRLEVTTGTAAAPAWNGKRLAACAAAPAAPCLQSEGSHAARVFVTGPGKLHFTTPTGVASLLTIAGGARDRALELALRF